MIPGFTLRECRDADMRRQEFLRTVARERRLRADGASTAGDFERRSVVGRIRTRLVRAYQGGSDGRPAKNGPKGRTVADALPTGI